ncbi:unknown [Bacteroides clarus CAG:160]|nr:unknown [Bacteroides clarus CAG:160]
MPSYSTFIVKITDRSIAFYLFRTTAGTQCMLMSDTGLRNHISPIGSRYGSTIPATACPSFFNISPSIGVFCSIENQIITILGRLVASRIFVRFFVVISPTTPIDILGRVHHFGIVLQIFDSNRTGVVQRHFAFFTGFGSNQNNAIGTTGTVDSCGRGVFQHIDRFDILRIQGFNTAIGHQRDTVHYIQRGIAGAQRTHTAYVNCSDFPRALIADNVHTGCLTLHGFKSIGYRT